MINQFSATVIDGVLHPDQPLGLPDHSRVSVTIHAAVDQQQSLAALQSMQDRLKLRPVRTDGHRYTRDELHERR